MTLGGAGRSGPRGGTEIFKASMPGTARAASSPATSRRMPARWIGIIMTPAGFRSRTIRVVLDPERMTNDSSSRDTPAPKRRVLEQRPPIVRAASSTVDGPSS